jgi:hypothetical protein
MTHEKIVAALVEITKRAPRAGIGLRNVIHISPDVVKESKQCTAIGGWAGVADLSIYREIGDMRWVSDPSVAFARVELEPITQYKADRLRTSIVRKIVRFISARKELKCL